jgi:hypothetical protein
MFSTFSARALAAIGLAVVAGVLAGPAALAAPARSAGAGITYRSDLFQGVSCLASHGCVAVGSQYSSTTKTTKALAETRGSSAGSWTVHDPPRISGAPIASFGPIGNGETVSCVAKPFTCLGIGSYNNKSLHQLNYAAKWNGKSWKTVNPPDPKPTVSSGLDAISCLSAHFCLVVGHWYSLAKFHDELESLQWNGSKWKLTSTLPLPAKASSARLWGLSCVSATWCMAVGDYNLGSAQPVLSETWNGKKWTIHRPPSPKHVAGSALAGVACVSKTFCNAVGDSLTSKLALLSLGETWNGHAWTIRPTPSGTQSIGSEFFDVKCQSRKSCLAVGTLAATWNGSAWHGVNLPVPSGSLVTTAVSLSCVSAKNCTATGSYASGASTLTTAWNWNGASLKLQSTPSP